MTTPRLIVENVWKKFRTGERHDSLRDLIPALFSGFSGRSARMANLEKDAFWALRSVSLDVGPGQALGVIGHNGAGKSTLLKILTQIIRPTAGRMKVTGRIGALIEIAAGFHPDLTGRENVFLQGAIMGMPAAAIRRRFDDIVDFAGVGQFIDTPVKRYSSGMNARLGFSIAVHLEPDVLVIDEVLSVGDMAFQTQAFDRMREVVRSGMPVVIVSHQLDRITELCTHAILLRRGEVIHSGTPDECVKTYVAGELPSRADSLGYRFGSVTLEHVSTEGVTATPSGDRVRIALRGIADRNTTDGGQIGIGFRVRRMETGQMVFSNRVADSDLPSDKFGRFAFIIELQMNVPAGAYALETWLRDPVADSVLMDGPGTVIQVTQGTPFSGTIQLNPTMKWTFDVPG